MASINCARVGGPWWYDFRMFQRYFLAGILVCAAAAAQAQPYRWVDEKGRPHYTDNPPPTAKGLKKSGSKTESPAEQSEQLPFELQRAQKDFPVTLYTAPPRLQVPQLPGRLQV